MPGSSREVRRVGGGLDKRRTFDIGTVDVVARRSSSTTRDHGSLRAEVDIYRSQLAGWTSVRRSLSRLDASKDALFLQSGFIASWHLQQLDHLFMIHEASVRATSASP